MGAGDGSVLVTGGLGCIGAWTVRELLLADVPVVVLDPSDDSHRLRQLIRPDMMDRALLVRSDISDLPGLEKLLAEHHIYGILHLAALQLPFCRADPPAGARVNVVGTVNIFEAARRADIPKVVYTSSIAVFDQKGGQLRADAEPSPMSHYGVYKLANEGTARAYWREFGVSSIGIRPMTVYGPGRDRGLTSSPTKAILAAVLGCRYKIAFGGSTFFNYATDVGRALALAVHTSVEGSFVVNLNGVRASVSDIVAALHRQVGSRADGITADRSALPFPDDVDTTGIEIIGPPPVTPLDEGIAATLEFFQDLLTRGLLVPEEHGLVVADGFGVDMASLPTTR